MREDMYNEEFNTREDMINEHNNIKETLKDMYNNQVIFKEKYNKLPKVMFYLSSNLFNIQNYKKHLIKKFIRRKN